MGYSTYSYASYHTAHTHHIIQHIAVGRPLLCISAFVSGACSWVPMLIAQYMKRVCHASLTQIVEDVMTPDPWCVSRYSRSESIWVADTQEHCKILCTEPGEDSACGAAFCHSHQACVTCVSDQDCGA
eukprot:GHVO01047772.1.p1 GENE.GHVO01047772.1~~GHVO01047772.1.p1  ORF type:complete len:128 (+),score=4.62 GHVO01047772.1:138-521(+)